MDCKNCKTFYCPEHGFNFEKKCNRYTPPTNADRIRAMTDEELADVFDHIQGDAYLVGIGQRKNSLYPGASMSWIDWLKQEAT